MHKRFIYYLVVAGLFAFILFLSFIVAKQLILAFYHNSPAALLLVSKPNIVGDKSPPLTKLILGELTDEVEEINLKGVKIKFQTKPSIIKENKETLLYFYIKDTSGKPLVLDKSIHYTRMHVYAIHEDLRSPLIHLHPSTSNEDDGTNEVSFPSAGKWLLVIQIAKEGIMYQVQKTFDIRGKETPQFTPDLSSTQRLNKWDITLKASPYPIKSNNPTHISFTAVPRPGGNPPRLEGVILDKVNLVVVDETLEFVWNIHGDKSVDAVSSDAGIPSERLSTSTEPFGYNITFPKPGLWLLHFEIQSIPVQFFIKVLP